MEHNALQGGAVLFVRPDVQAVFFRGPDRKEFLHRLLTSPVQKLQAGQGQPSLLLDPRGKILVRMNLLGREEEILALVEGSFAGRLLESLERYRFSERVEMEDASKKFSILSLRGPKADATIESILPKTGETLGPWAHRSFDWNGFSITAVRNIEEDGWELVLPVEPDRRFRETLLKKFSSLEICEGRHESLEIARIERGVARYGVEIDESCYPQEAGWESYCAPDKGCYIGQETVARMNTYGKPPRRLVALAFPEGKTVSPGSALQRGGAVLGLVRSCVSSVRFGIPLGLGFVKSEEATPENFVEGPGGERIDIVPLPLTGTSFRRYLTHPGA